MMFGDFFLCFYQKLFFFIFAPPLAASDSKIFRSLPDFEKSVQKVCQIFYYLPPAVQPSPARNKKVAEICPTCLQLEFLIDFLKFARLQKIDQKQKKTHTKPPTNSPQPPNSLPLKCESWKILNFSNFSYDQCFQMQ